MVRADRVLSRPLGSKLLTLSGKQPFDRFSKPAAFPPRDFAFDHPTAGWILTATASRDYGSFACFAFVTFDHRARAAFRALALRCSGVSLAALVFPPLEPPIFPKAIACGFFSRFAIHIYMQRETQKIKRKALDKCVHAYA